MRAGPAGRGTGTTVATAQGGQTWVLEWGPYVAWSQAHPNSFSASPAAHTPVCSRAHRDTGPCLPLPAHQGPGSRHTGVRPSQSRGSRGPGPDTHARILMGTLQRCSRQRSSSFLGKLLSLPFTWWHPRICMVSGLITGDHFKLPVRQQPALMLELPHTLAGPTPSSEDQRIKRLRPY